jgi:hypothetical protein
MTMMDRVLDTSVARAASEAAGRAVGQSADDLEVRTIASVRQDATALRLQIARELDAAARGSESPREAGSVLSNPRNGVRSLRKRHVEMRELALDPNLLLSGRSAGGSYHHHGAGEGRALGESKGAGSVSGSNLFAAGSGPNSSPGTPRFGSSGLGPGAGAGVAAGSDAMIVGRRLAAGNDLSPNTIASPLSNNSGGGGGIGGANSGGGGGGAGGFGLGTGSSPQTQQRRSTLASVAAPVGLSSLSDASSTAKRNLEITSGNSPSSLPPITGSRLMK